MVRKETKERKVIRVRHWPEGDRPQKRLLEKGPEALSDAALLAVLLKSGGEKKDAVSLAREVLTEFGGFRGLLSATRQDLGRMKRIGKAGTAQILAAMEIIRRQIREPLERVNLVQNPHEAHQYLSASMGELEGEEWRVLHLGRSNHLVSEEVLCRGTPEACAVEPGDVVKSALRKKSSGLILAHNQPSGLLRASEEDIRFTKSLVHACWTADIPLMDHIIIGRDGLMSMRRRYPDLFEGEDDVA